MNAMTSLSWLFIFLIWTPFPTRICLRTSWYWPTDTMTIESRKVTNLNIAIYQLFFGHGHLMSSEQIITSHQSLIHEKWPLCEWLSGLCQTEPCAPVQNFFLSSVYQSGILLLTFIFFLLFYFNNRFDLYCLLS